MLRKIFSIAFKEFRLWIQTPGNWLTVFLVPILFISILGSVFSGGTPVVTVFAVNADKGERGAEIIDLLAKSDTRFLFHIVFHISRFSSSDIIGLLFLYFTD